jgi:hypothetical protein
VGHKRIPRGPAPSQPSVPAPVHSSRCATSTLLAALAILSIAGCAGRSDPAGRKASLSSEGLMRGCQTLDAQLGHIWREMDFYYGSKHAYPREDWARWARESSSVIRQASVEFAAQHPHTLGLSQALLERRQTFERLADRVDAETPEAGRGGSISHGGFEALDHAWLAVEADCPTSPNPPTNQEEPGSG